LITSVGVGVTEVVKVRRSGSTQGIHKFDMWSEFQSLCKAVISRFVSEGYFRRKWALGNEEAGTKTVLRMLDEQKIRADTRGR
jgi:hypothetical protein